MKKLFMCWLLAHMLMPAKLFSQETFVNRVFQETAGSPQFNPILNPLGVQWSKTINSAAGGIIIVGYTAISGEGQNIFLIKYDSDGNVVFQKDYNTSSTDNDYGIGVYEAGNGDIYVCGTTDNGGSTNYDAVMLRYNSSGILLNATTKDGPAGANDAAVSILKDATTGNVIVAANTEDSNGFSDMWVLKYSSSLSFIGSNTYDYVGLNDFALGVSMAGSTIKIIGPSASSASACDYVQVNYNISTLSFGSVTRNNIPGTALDQAIDFCKDANDNTYITGKAWNGTNFEIKTIRINANFSLDWTMTFDLYGIDNAGSTITTDGSGNIIVAGYSTKANNKKELVCLKYNASTGSLIWSYKRSATDPTGDAYIKKIVTNPFTDDIYFIGNEKTLTGNKVLVGKIKSGGTNVWERNIGDNPTLSYLPSDISYDSGEIYVISIKDSVTDQYIVTSFEELTLDTARVYLTGQPAYMAHELLVDFMPSSMNKSAINNQIGTKIAEFGNLSDFLTTSAMNAINLAFESSCPGCHLKAVRVHAEMKTTDTLGVNNLGLNVPNPPVWSILLVQIPNTITIQKAKHIFSSLKNYVSYVQYDNFMELTSPPNDSLYSTQASIHLVGGNTNAHINVEDAWNVVTGCGASFVKGGVFDTGVMWRHKDFGYTGSPTSGKVEGWLFSGAFGAYSSSMGGLDIKTTIYAIPDNNFDSGTFGGHATAVAGIIGAKRNNTSGIAGIAGGDDANGNNGVSLYSLNVSTLNKMFWVLKSFHAVHGGPTQSPLLYNYGVHFSNHSYKMTPGWWGADSLPLYRDEVHFANRMQVTFIASRSNDSTNNFVAPANYDSCWAISTGASAANGLKWSGSSYGSNMDVIAPGTYDIVKTTASDGYYKAFAGTSAAVPHVSGVVALLMSYMNNPNGNADYKNLAPEDCDYIIQRSATDVGPPGYDSLNGYGRLNAGAALRMVEKPVRVLYHFGTNAWTPHTISKSVYANYDTVKLTEKYATVDGLNTYNPGKYLVKTFEVQATISHPGLYSTDSIMHHWARHSSSNLFGLPTAQKKLDLHQRIFFVSFSPSSATIKGYLYQVKDSTGTTNLGWWPCDTTFSLLNTWSQHLFEYSILSKNKAVGIVEYEKLKDNIRLFPNPATQQQTLIIKIDKVSNCKIELYDVTGRYLRNVYNGKIEIGSNTIVHNVASLTNSMYIYLITIDGKVTSRKFIKE